MLYFVSYLGHGVSPQQKELIQRSPSQAAFLSLVQKTHSYLMFHVFLLLLTASLVFSFIPNQLLHITHDTAEVQQYWETSLIPRSWDSCRSAGRIWKNVLTNVDYTGPPHEGRLVMSVGVKVRAPLNITHYVISRKSFSSTR